MRLPADSLKICKRVCKPWFHLINKPSFVSKHLVRVSSTQNNNDKKNPKSFFLKWIRQDLSAQDIDQPNLSEHGHANDLSKLELSVITLCEDHADADES